MALRIFSSVAASPCDVAGACMVLTGREAPQKGRRGKLRQPLALGVAMQRRPAGPEPAEKRVCVSPELIDLTCDDDDFAPPRRVHKARSLESWVAKASAARDIDMHTIEQPLRRPPAAVPERGVASESLDEKPADESRTDGSSVGGKEKRFYYLANFWKVVEAVEAAYGKLFLPAELVYLQRLRALPDGSLRLFVRLLGRDPTWFRIDDLEARYAYEVTSVGDSLELLVRDGLAVSASVQDLARPEVLRDVLELLRRDEVSAVLASMRHGARSTAKKKDLTEQLVALVAHPPLAVTGEPLPVLARVLETAKRVVALHSDVKGFCQRMFRLFFLADGLNHQELFKADANIIRFPKYPLSGTGSLFPTRLHLSAWEECRLWQQRFDASAPVLKAKPEARTACVDILHYAAEWLLACSNELNDPLFLGGSKTAPSVGLGEAVRAAIGSRRALPECLTLSQLSFAGACALVCCTFTDSSYVDAEVLVAKRPVFARYTPGHILARLSWDVLDVVLQKEKSYTLVNTFLRLLLSTPFGFSKRGEWWGRLVVNFKHLKNLVRLTPHPCRSTSQCGVGRSATDGRDGASGSLREDRVPVRAVIARHLLADAASTGTHFSTTSSHYRSPRDAGRYRCSLRCASRATARSSGRCSHGGSPDRRAASSPLRAKRSQSRCQPSPHRRTDAQTHKHTDTQTCKHTDISLALTRRAASGAGALCAAGGGGGGRQAAVERRTLGERRMGDALQSAALGRHLGRRARRLSHAISVCVPTSSSPCAVRAFTAPQRRRSIGDSIASTRPARTRWRSASCAS